MLTNVVSGAELPLGFRQPVVEPLDFRDVEGKYGHATPFGAYALRRSVERGGFCPSVQRDGKSRPGQLRCGLQSDSPA